MPTTFVVQGEWFWLRCFVGFLKAFSWDRSCRAMLLWKVLSFWVMGYLLFRILFDLLMV